MKYSNVHILAVKWSYRDSLMILTLQNPVIIGFQDLQDFHVNYLCVFSS